MILQFSPLSLNFDLPHNFNVEGVQSQVLQLNHIHDCPCASQVCWHGNRSHDITFICG